MSEDNNSDNNKNNHESPVEPDEKQEKNENFVVEDNKNYIYNNDKSTRRRKDAAYDETPRVHTQNDSKESNMNYDKILTEYKLPALSESDGRWEYLYRLNKLKMIKNNYIKEIVEKDKIEREIAECTFVPQTNYNKHFHYNSSKLINTSQIYNKCLNNSINAPILGKSFNNSKVNSNSSKPEKKLSEVGPAAYNKIPEAKEFMEYDIIERHKILQKNKNEKIQILKMIDDEKENQECLFKPQIVYYLYLINLNL